MLLSMTGFGATQTQWEGLTIVSEIKTVNNRYLKINFHIPDAFSCLESSLESLIKNHIERGTVSLSLRVITETPESVTRLNLPLLKSYLNQASELDRELNSSGVSISLGSLSDYFKLPGVILESIPDNSEEYMDMVWKGVAVNLEQSLGILKQSRLREGKVMEEDLRCNCALLSQKVEEIALLAPQVVDSYRAHLSERVEKIMTEKNLPWTQADLVREITLFTDKADISEEIVRFRSHLKQFDKVMTDSESCGKKLDFLTQELLREANTMGSKGNSAEITNHVVVLKTTIERIREMVQNVE